MKISIAVATAILGYAFASPRHVRVSERSLQGSMTTSPPMTTINVAGSKSNPGTPTNDAPNGSIGLAFKDPDKTESRDTSSNDDPIGSDDPSGTSEDSDDPTGDDLVGVRSEDMDVTGTRSGSNTETSADSNDLTSDGPDGVSSQDMNDTTNDDPVGFDDPTGTSADSDDLTDDDQAASNLVIASAKLKASTTISSKAISPANKAIFSGVASAAVLVGAIALF